MHTLITLMRKDWRLYGIPVLACVILGITPYVVAVVAYSFDPYRHELLNMWQDHITGAAIFSMLIMGVMSAVFGGVAFATERRERWADFLNLLPPSRAAVILSKLMVSVSSILLLTLVHVGVLLLVGAGAPGRIDRHLISGWASGAILLFGVSWLLSTFLNSAAISASVPIALAAAIGATIGMLDGHQWRGEWSLIVWIVCTTTIGVVCLAAGTIHYLRRVGP